MADESMVRNLAAQADAIWPQEKPLFDRYRLPDDANVLDAGCGTGEITRGSAQMFPKARVLGVDIIDGHLEMARAEMPALGERVRFENRSIFELGLPDAHFDLVVCRHVLQAIPHADRAIAELVRVTRRGGWLHLIAEDYLMINFEPRRLDPDDFWQRGPAADSATPPAPTCASAAHAYGILRRLGLLEHHRRLRRRRSAARAARDVRRHLEGVARRIRRCGFCAHADVTRDVRGALRRHDRDARRSRRLRRVARPCHRRTGICSSRVTSLVVTQSSTRRADPLATLSAPGNNRPRRRPGPSAATTPASVSGSCGDTPVNCVAMNRVAPKLASSPIAAPMAIRRSPITDTIRSTSRRPAPSAMRMPISRVCRATV